MKTTDEDLRRVGVVVVGEAKELVKTLLERDIPTHCVESLGKLKSWGYPFDGGVVLIGSSASLSGAEQMNRTQGIPVVKVTLEGHNARDLEWALGEICRAFVKLLEQAYSRPRELHPVIRHRLDLLRSVSSELAHEVSNLVMAVGGLSALDSSVSRKLLDGAASLGVTSLDEGMDRVGERSKQALWWLRTLCTLRGEAPERISVHQVLARSIRVLRRCVGDEISVRLGDSLSNSDSSNEQNGSAVVRPSVFLQLVAYTVHYVGESVPTGASVNLDLSQESGRGVRLVVEGAFESAWRGEITRVPSSDIFLQLRRELNASVKLERSVSGARRVLLDLPQAAAAAVQPAMVRGHSKGMVAEKNRQLKGMMAAALDDVGADVVMAENAQSVLTLASRFGSSLRLIVISQDLTTDPIDEFLLLLRERCPRARIVVTTRSEVILPESLLDQVHIFLKPFRLSALVRIAAPVFSNAGMESL